MLERYLFKMIYTMRPVILPIARSVKRSSIMKKYIIPWLIKEEIGKIPCNSEIKLIINNIKTISCNDKPIIVGPWLSELGFEILYWIPFLNWIMTNYNIEKRRIIIVSRGGCEQWYKNIGSNYIDIFDYFSPEEFKSKNIKRIERLKTQKHIIISEFDAEIIERIKRGLNIKDFEWLHPSLMYRLFRFFWRRELPISFIENYLEYKKFIPFSDKDFIKNFPNDYIAVKFYFSECFPDTSENRKFINDLLKQLTKHNNVVILNTCLNIDDHKDYDELLSKRIYNNLIDIRELITPRNNLYIQSQIVSNASLFLGTYGGFSYLAPFYGIPSIALYSNEEKFLQIHLDLVYRAIRKLKYGFFDKVIKTKEYKLLTSGRPEFMPININNFDILKILF